jgi:hypothetical protein
MPSKTNYKDFSAKVKVKYPEYGNMDDLSLAKMWVEQNPQYGEFVVFDEPTPQKKSPVGTTPGQPVGSQFVSSGDPIADRAQTQSAIKGYAKNKDKAEEIGYWENLGLNFANGSNNFFNNAFRTAYEGSLAMQGVPVAGIQELSKYNSKPLKEDFRTKTRQEMGLLEESTAAFANSLPIMLSSMAMGGAANIATKAGKVAGALPSFISGFQESGKEADEIGIKDPLDRLAFQTAGGGIEAVSEFILPDASLIRPLRQRALKDLVRVGSKGLSKADVGRYVAEFTEKVAKEIGEEYAVEVGQALRGVSFAVAGYDSAMPEMKSARDYAVMTLSAAIGAGTFGGVGTLADAAYAKSSAIKKASENPEEATQAVADLIDAGKLTEEQGNEFLTKVNMLSRTSSRMPKNIDPEVAVNSSELLNQKMDIEEQINALEEEKKGIDDSFVPEIDTQIASLTEQLNSLTQQISSIRPTELEGATIELDIPDVVDLSTEDQSVLDIMSSRFEEPYLNAINQRINNAEEISLSEIENIAGDMINELTVVSESQDLTDSQKQQLSQLVENQIDNLLNYEFATTTTTEQAGQKTKAAGIISTPREGRPLPESKVSRERFEGAGVRIGGRGAGRVTVKPIAGFGGRSVYGISFGNRKGVTPVEDLEFDNLEFVAPVILEDGSFNARMRDSKTGLELTITDPELSIDLAIAESLRQAGKTTFPQPAFLEAFNEVTKGTPTRTTTFPNIGRTGTAPEAAGVQPQTEQDVRQETNVTQERGDEGEASSRLPQEEGRQEGQVTPAVEGEAQASPTAKKKKTAQERADEQKATLEKLKETLKSLKAKPGGGANIDLTFGVVPITKAVWNTAIDTAILAIDAGQTIAQAVKAASDYISSQIQGDWGKGKFESYMNDQFASVTGEGVKQKLKLSSNPTLNTFLNELNQIEGIERSPIDPSELIYGETAAITLRPGDNENEIDISSIRSLDKGKGLGKKAMNDINSVADKLGITLRLNAKPFGTTGLSKADLIKFYQKAGFRADLTEYGGEFASEEEMISYVNEVDGESLPMIRLPNIKETEIDVKDVSVKKNEDNDHIVSFKGVEVGKMRYDRSIGFWINADFDRSKEKPYSVKSIYGDILGDTKDEAISELVNRFNKGSGPKAQENPIAESRREFREKARKYFDGLKKLGFAFDAERNAKEDIAFFKALKDYIKLEIDNGMVTFKGFIDKASAIMPEFSNAELKAKAKELWGQEVVKEYPKLMAKYSKVKQQQLEGEIKEIKKDLAGRILKMTSPKAVNVKGQIKTEKRKLSQEAAGQLATIRDAFDMKSMLAMDPKDLLELYNLTSQIYKEGRSDIDALNEELNKQAESQGDAMLEAISSEGKRLQKLKDEATARKKLSLNAGVVIAMNEDERVLLKTEKELDALEGKGYTFMFLNTKGDKYSDRNFLTRFFSGSFRSLRENARDLRTALEFIKSPAKSSQEFINGLVEKMNKASVIKARKTDSWSSILKEARNKYFGSDLNFSYTNWMNGVPKVDGNVLEIEDGTGERIQGMTNAKIVTLYRQIMDPRNLVKPKGNEKGPRKINLTDKSIQDIIDYMNLAQNEAGKEFALSLNEFFTQVAKDVSQVLESNGYNADKLKEARYDKDKVNDEFIVKIMDQFVSMRPDGFIPYTPVQATDSPDMAQGVEITEDDLLNSTDLQKNFSVISNNMITKKPGGQIVPTDIRQTLNAYTAGMANMSAKLPLLRETQAVFSKKNLTAMNNAFAPQFTENLKANYISYMTDRIVPTSSSKTSAAIKSWLMQSTAIPMFLNFKSSVLQLLAAPNFLASYDFSKYIDSFKELSKNPRLMGVTILEIIDLPTVNQRFGSRFSPDSRAISDDTSTYGNLSFKIPFTDLKISSKELLSKGYIFSSFGDVLSIAIGGAPVYYDIKKTNKAKYLSEGMSERDAESKAREDAEEKLYEIIQETQQSSDAMYLSQFQKQSITRLFSSFATATMQYYRKARRASLRMKNKEWNQRQNAYEILHYTVINAAVFQLFSSMLIDAISGPGEDELEEMNRQERMDLVRYMEDVMATVAQGTGAMGVALQALILGLKEAEKSGKPEKIVESTLRTMPAVRMKYEAAVNAIREWKRGDYVKSFTKGGELVNIPADRIRSLGLQVSDALMENLEFQERMYRLLGFRTESWMREKKQGEIWDGIQSRIDNSTVSERQRAISQTMEDYRSLFKDYGKRYAEAKTEADRKRIDSIAVKELGNVYNHRKGGEEFSDELRKIASRSIEFYSLPKDLQELKDKNSDKKIETIVNEYIRLEKKDPKKADKYWSLLVANEIVSKNEIKKIAEEYDTEKGHR